MFVLLTSVHSKWILQVSYVWAFCCQILLFIWYQQNCLLANYVNWELEIEMLKKLTFPNLIYFKLKMSTCIAYLSIENDLKKWNSMKHVFFLSYHYHGLFHIYLRWFLVWWIIYIHCTLKMVVRYICIYETFVFANYESYICSSCSIYSQFALWETHFFAIQFINFSKLCNSDNMKGQFCRRL